MPQRRISFAMLGTTAMSSTVSLAPGQVFGRLTTIEVAGYERLAGYLRPRMRCLCSCGNEKEVSLGHLRSGKIRSCGCLLRERARVLGKTYGGVYKKGGRRSR